MRHSILGAAAVLAAFTATPALAWDGLGHMTVAAVAWNALEGSPARARATALIRLNPMYNSWIAGVAPADRDRVAFVKAATWPDLIRGKVCSRTNPPPCYRNDGYTPADAASDMNIGYDDLRLRKYWHFKNLPFSTDGTALKQPFQFNAETQIVAFDAAIGDTTLSDEARSYDLVWLMHLVGDVHQPLHAVGRFNAETPNGDSGGNDVGVCPTTSRACDATHFTSFHTFWDHLLGDSTNGLRAFQIAGDIQAEPVRLKLNFTAADLSAAPSAWLQESLVLAKDSAYVGPIGPGKGPYRLTVQYQRASLDIAYRQVALGGARLAELIKRRLG